MHGIQLGFFAHCSAVEDGTAGLAAGVLVLRHPIDRAGLASPIAGTVEECTGHLTTFIVCERQCFSPFVPVARLARHGGASLVAAHLIALEDVGAVRFVRGKALATRPQGTSLLAALEVTGAVALVVISLRRPTLTALVLIAFLALAASVLLVAQLPGTDLDNDPHPCSGCEALHC